MKIRARRIEAITGVAFVCASVAAYVALSFRPVTAQSSELLPILYPGNTTCSDLGYQLETRVQCPNGTCFKVPGYWRKHSEFGPASYDPTWSKLASGASTQFPFVRKPVTYHNVLWLNASGDPYWSLAQLYIAIQLNVLSGKTLPASINQAWSDSGKLLAKYSSGSIPNKSTDRAKASSLAGVLWKFLNAFTAVIPVGSSDSIRIVTDDNIVFDWTSTFVIDAVIVKGGPSANVYLYPGGAVSGTGLAAPLNLANNEPFDLGSVRFCYNQVATPTPTPTPTPTSTPTPTPTNTPTPTPTGTPTPTPTSTPTPTPTGTPTPTPTSTPTPTPTSTPTPTPTSTPTPTPTDTPTPTPTGTPTPTPTPAL
jgi:hypothetical protein